MSHDAWERQTVSILPSPEFAALCRNAIEKNDGDSLEVHLLVDE